MLEKSKSLSSNRTIAKNTLFMYFRMLVLLVISLVSSRVILQTLGIYDYGTYNVVAGVVVMFSFINGALTTGTQRHISYALGEDKEKVPQIFSACFKVHFFIAIIILILAETVGLWFLNNKMNFPEGRLLAANVVYQFSIICCLISVVQTPYSAAIVAYEVFSFYAYCGILESVLKLLIVLSLLLFCGDKLIIYAILHFLVVIIIFVINVTYSHRHLSGVVIQRVKDKNTFKYLFSFSGWTLFGSFGQLLESQGLNILINIFYGVAINAAVGIANQVKAMLVQFASGFQQALNPQLVMAQSSGNREKQLKLIYNSSKFSYLILYVLALPTMYKLQDLLHWWLGLVPEYTVEITALFVAAQLTECLASPLYTTIFAIGDIKNYQITVFLIRISSIVLGFIVGKGGMLPYIMFVAPFVVTIALLVYRMKFVKKKIAMPITDFFSNVLKPILLVTLFTMTIFMLFTIFDIHIISWFVDILFMGLYGIAVAIFIGMTKSERNNIIALCTNRFNNVLK